MSGGADAQAERQNLLIRLLDAVKQCQVRFGGRRELATEGDSRVSCLCATWEAALSHGMRHTNKALSTLKQVTELTGLSKVASNIGIIENIHNMETEPVFWQYVKEHLSKHESQRYVLLRHVTTDAGRGRAWLRSTLNEHSLEKYMHMILEDNDMIKTFYDESAFLRDQERASMLPMMAAGLGSILFAINIDNPDLNAIKPAAGLDAILSSTPPNRAFPPRPDEEPRPVIHSDLSPKNERKKERKKKKKVAHIVSFDDDDGTSSYCSTSPGSSVTSPLTKSSGVEFTTLPTIVAGSASARTTHGFSQAHPQVGTVSAEKPPLQASGSSGMDTYHQIVTGPKTVTSQDIDLHTSRLPDRSKYSSSIGGNDVLPSSGIAVLGQQSPQPAVSAGASHSELLNGHGDNQPAETNVKTIVSDTMDKLYTANVATDVTHQDSPANVATVTTIDYPTSVKDATGGTLSQWDGATTGAGMSNTKAVLDELRCPSVMNGSGGALCPDEPKPSLTETLINQNDKSAIAPGPPTSSTGPSSNSVGSHHSAVGLSQSAGKEGVESSGKSAQKEVLLDWDHNRDRGSGDGQCDSKVETASNKISDNNCETKPQRVDSVSEGYTNMVLAAIEKAPQKETIAKESSTGHKPGPQGSIHSSSSNITKGAPVYGHSRNDSIVSDTSKAEDTWSYTNESVRTESTTSYHSSPNRSPHKGQGGSPYRQSSPRPESIKGLDISERYRLPRCDSSDSVPGSMSDSVRTNDSLRQRFGRWDSTDSADVRSITSNSSLGETGPSPTLPQVSSTLTSSTTGVPASLTPVSPDGRPLEGDFMMPIARTTASSEDSRSYDSVEVPSYTEDTENAAYALAVTQQGLLASSGLEKLGATSPEAVSNESLSPDELKQALIAMMLQKDETESLRRALETALEVEREVNTALRAEVAGLKQGAAQMEERDTEKIKSLSKENELLKHQLRKYVNAVQLLRTQGAKTEDIPGIHLEDVQPTIPAPRQHIDYSHEASEYEKKLIQVAEMHGELMEFNEVLHRHLSVKEATIQRLKQELTDLRGPLPEDFQMSDDSVSVTSDIDMNAFNRPLVNIWIPSAFLRGAGSDAFHVYQVYVRIRDEEWNIYRRYAEFHDLHAKLKKKYPIVNSYEFPSKKTFGNRDPKFVEERRRKLQIYLRQVINLFLQTNPDFVANVSRTRLLQVAPFFGDVPSQEKKNKGKRKVSRGAPSSRAQAPSSSPAPQQHYMGL